MKLLSVLRTVVFLLNVAVLVISAPLFLWGVFAFGMSSWYLAFLTASALNILSVSLPTSTSKIITWFLLCFALIANYLSMRFIILSVINIVLLLFVHVARVQAWFNEDEWRLPDNNR